MVRSLLDCGQHARPATLAKRDMAQRQDNQEYLTSCAPLELYHGHYCVQTHTHTHTHSGHRVLTAYKYTHFHRVVTHTQTEIRRPTHTLKQPIARTAQS